MILDKHILSERVTGEVILRIEGLVPTRSFSQNLQTLTFVKISKARYRFTKGQFFCLCREPEAQLCFLLARSKSASTSESKQFA